MGPVILGLAGSLKLFPLVFVAGYLSERRWLAAAVAIGVASMLWLNILAFDVLLYTQIGGPSFYVGGISIYSVSPLMWVGVAGTLGLLLLSLVARRSPWAWLASAACHSACGAARVATRCGIPAHRRCARSFQAGQPIRWPADRDVI